MRTNDGISVAHSDTGPAWSADHITGILNMPGYIVQPDSLRYPTKDVSEHRNVDLVIPVKRSVKQTIRECPGDISTVHFFKSQSDMKKALQQQIQKKFRKKDPGLLPISGMIYKSNHNLVYLDPEKLALKAIFLIIFEDALFLKLHGMLTGLFIS
ncbi:hypothetical protein Nepgr_016285 [Nepenthes gracilis]|uniref:Uncharacterized protein n=1 Tax=Nepenthes gracilis TaxID=150966 RepID=A0AAD3XRX5_NEPGR|nr:hypothetical protein Nepgr_016285 [Nepenthes gracilis]